MLDLTHLVVVPFIAILIGKCITNNLTQIGQGIHDHNLKTALQNKGKKHIVQCVKECLHRIPRNFRTYSDVGYETVRGYDEKLRHFTWHSRIQSEGASQNNRLKAKLFGFELCEKYFRQLLTSKIL